MLNDVMKMMDSNRENLYLGFRLLIGLLFFLNGAGQLGLLAGGFAIPGGVFGIAAFIEVFVGLAIFFGYFSRLAAGIGAGDIVCPVADGQGCSGYLK